MDKVVINKNFMKDLKIHSINKNSNIFVKGNDLIKMPIIREEYKNSNLEMLMVSNMEKNIELVSNIEGNYYILPKYSLYKSKVDSCNYKGYGMNFFHDYKTLSSVIESEEYLFKDRLDLCKNLCSAIIRLEKYKISYWDLHTENVLINEKNIKICDIDSIVSQFVSGYIEYKKTLMCSYKHLSLLLLSILYGMDESDLYNIIKANKNTKFIKDSKLFKRVIDNSYYMFYPDKYLDSFTEEYIEDTKLLLKRQF